MYWEKELYIGRKIGGFIENEKGGETTVLEDESTSLKGERKKQQRW
jgi:hypothetical protein